MSISVDWYVPNKVLLIKIAGNLALPDMLGLISQLESYKQTLHEFHQIYDLTEMVKFLGLTEFKQGLRPDLMTTGYIFAVGSMNPMVKFMSSTVIQFTGVRLKTAPTVEEAINQLQKLDPALKTPAPADVSSKA
ncbi:MAG: hypothetical protein KF716_33930 [Anaerolineae bacterium]|nr:hypothetical protein [Anaerolineae bacterium]